MSPKKKNVTFNALMVEELLDLMYEQVLLGRKANRGFKMDAYKHVADAMTEHSDGAYILTGQAVQNRCKHMKKNYSIVTKMLNASGFGYDNTTKCIITSENVWADWIQLWGCRIQSSGVETSSRSNNVHKRNSELLEIISCIEKSSEGLQIAICDVAMKQHATFILTELLGIPELSGLDVKLSHEWLTVHQDMATVFITANNKE